MTVIAVTGAAGTVGRRVVSLLAAESGVQVIAVDRVPMRPDDGVERRQGDVSRPEARLLAGAESVVHLAEDPGRRADPDVALRTLDGVLDGARRVGARHLVVLSSALVYGARPSNPVPLTESHPRRPNPGQRYALVKAAVEDRAERWADEHGVDVAVLRPATALSEDRSSYVATSLRTAIALRDDEVDAPVQFLHHQDLASAVALVSTRQLTGVYNVAPDHWIEPDEFRRLLSEIELPRPPVATAVARVVGPLVRPDEAAGLVPYVRHPWVVANDRLRAEGWVPGHTNQEAMVVSTPTPWLRSVWVRRRQEFALGAVGLTTAGAMAAVGAAARWAVRSR